MGNNKSKETINYYSIEEIRLHSETIMCNRELRRMIPYSSNYLVEFDIERTAKGPQIVGTRVEGSYFDKSRLCLAIVMELRNVTPEDSIGLTDTQVQKLTKAGIVLQTRGVFIN